MPDVPVSSDLTEFLLDSESATERLARAVSQTLKPGDTLLLSGQIGAGKTFFARAMIQHRLAELGRYEDVPSPSFTLVQTYDLGGCEMWHVDLYRLSNIGELDDLGLEDAFDEAICVVEWPDRLGPLRPVSSVELTFTVTGETSRSVAIHFPADAARWADLRSVLVR